MNTLTEQIRVAITDSMQKISAAAQRQDLAALEQLTKRASELRAMKDQVEAIENRLQALGSRSSTNVPTTQTSTIRRELIIDVTQGMINQSLLTLTQHVKRGRIIAGETLSVEALPSGARFQTEVLAKGNKVRERGKIADFYRDAGVRAGDSVVLSEVTPGQWQLRKRP